MSRLTLGPAMAVGLLSLLPSFAHAAAPADFYKGRTVFVIIGYSPGGTYDLYARLVARYLGNYIPGKPIAETQLFFPNFWRKRSTRPAVSTRRCLPV